MQQKSPEPRRAVDLHERPDATPTSDVERLLARAARERAEYIADMTARAAEAIARLARVTLVRPIRRALGSVN